MLTADAFGVMPPIARLTPDQAMYHFLSGYTAKVAGTEKGVTEPEATFSTCFGAPFMPRHPSEYGNLLKTLIAEHGVNCWLVNTGWTGGAYGTGKPHADQGDARAARGSARRLAGKGGVPHGPRTSASPCRWRSPASITSILDPRSTWSDGAAYDAQARKLVDMFIANFAKFENHVDGSVRDAAPGCQGRCRIERQPSINCRL